MNEEEKKFKSRRRTKSEIEADVPFIDPKNCPGAVIKYFNKQRNADYLAIREIIQDELAPVKKFMKIAANNQIWLLGLSIVVFGICVVLWVHLA